MQLRSGQFYGNTVRTRAFSGFGLADTAYRPGMRIASHVHQRPYVSFLLRGSYTERYRNRTRRCEFGTVLVHPPGEMHADQFDENGGRVLSLEMPSEFWGPSPCRLVADDAAEMYEVANLMSRLGWELAFGNASSIAIEAIAFELAGIVERAFAPARQPPRWLREAVAMLQERFYEPLSLEQIAAAIGVHPVHLARTFRAVCIARSAITCAMFVSHLPAANWPRTRCPSLRSPMARVFPTRAICVASSSDKPE